MKARWTLLAALLACTAIPAIAGTPLSVKELGALIGNMQQERKSDPSIADKLKDTMLSEQLTPAALAQLRAMDPGPLTLEQIRILAVRSALLPPPAAYLPATAAPDMEQQKAILGRTVNYLSDFMKEPKLVADKTTIRYQNGPDQVWASNGGGSLMGQADLGRQFAPATPYYSVLGAHTMPVVVAAGVELHPAPPKRGDPGNRNGQISQGGPGPLLGVAFEEAARNKLQFARWETVNGKALAVFSFEVPKKKSHYEVNYCCFPRTQNVGSHLAGPAGSPAGGGAPVDPASYATLTTFSPFHAKVGYHGEFFIDPASGAVVRFIMKADMKQSDFVRQEDTRIDYGPATVGGRTVNLPEDSYILTTVIPQGDSFQRIAPRHTLFEVHYTNYREPSSEGEPANKPPQG